MKKIDENLIDKLGNKKKDILSKIEILIKESGLFPFYKTRTKKIIGTDIVFKDYGNGRGHSIHFINSYTKELQNMPSWGNSDEPKYNSLTITWSLPQLNEDHKYFKHFDDFCIYVPKIEQDTFEKVEKSFFSSKIIKIDFYKVDLTYTCRPFSNVDPKVGSYPVLDLSDLIEKCKSVISINEQEIYFLNKLKLFVDDVLNKLEKEIQISLNEFENKIQEFDKDNNGIVDVVEGYEDFMNLLKKYQKDILLIDRNYIQQFIKISNYLKTKRENIQNLFYLIKQTSKLTDLDEWIENLKSQCHSLELIFFHSINMITSLIEDDLITFYEIYESFDKLNIFNSNWENEMSQKLTNIEVGLDGLIYSIQKMEDNIVNQIGNLSYVTQQSFNQLNQSVIKELSSINSSIQFNNLLSSIQTYQMYKINKNTKSLNGSKN